MEDESVVCAETVFDVLGVLLGKVDGVIVVDTLRVLEELVVAVVVLIGVRVAVFEVVMEVDSVPL